MDTIEDEVTVVSVFLVGLLFLAAFELDVTLVEVLGGLLFFMAPDLVNFSLDLLLPTTCLRPFSSIM